MAERLTPAISASSCAVTAVSAPTKTGRRPVSLAAPMIVAAGLLEYSPSIVDRPSLRRAADAARIEQARAVAVVAVHVEAEGAGALDEERPPLGEERLERVEVHDRRIGFDLAEVGIDRRGQRQPGRHRVLQVEPERAAGIGRVGQRVPRVDRLRVDLADAVRHQLEASSPSPPSCRPLSSPNCETKPLALRASSGHVEVSVRRPTSRTTAKPTGPPAGR